MGERENVAQVRLRGREIKRVKIRLTGETGKQVFAGMGVEFTNRVLFQSTTSQP